MLEESEEEQAESQRTRVPVGGRGGARLHTVTFARLFDFTVTQTGRAKGWDEEETKVPTALSGSCYAATEEQSEDTGLLTLRPVHSQDTRLFHRPRPHIAGPPLMRACMCDSAKVDLVLCFSPSELTTVAEVDGS